MSDDVLEEVREFGKKREEERRKNTEAKKERYRQNRENQKEAERHEPRVFFREGHVWLNGNLLEKALGLSSFSGSQLAGLLPESPVPSADYEGWLEVQHRCWRADALEALLGSGGYGWGKRGAITRVEVADTDDLWRPRRTVRGPEVSSIKGPSRKFLNRRFRDAKGGLDAATGWHPRHGERAWTFLEGRRELERGELPEEWETADKVEQTFPIEIGYSMANDYVLWIRSLKDVD